MYGFGDDSQPYAESVELLEDLVVQYITDMVKIKQKQRKEFDNYYYFYFLDIKSNRNW